MSSMQILFGSDPEFMLVDDKGQLHSAIEIVKGTKDAKIQLGDGIELFHDNVNAELNIKPGRNEDEVQANIALALDGLRKTVAPYYPVARASADFPANELDNDEARAFGCEPEFCAYELSVITAPEPPPTFRSAGGHIHLGADCESYPLRAPLEGPSDDQDSTKRDMARIEVIRMMDVFVGLASVMLDTDPTTAGRRKLYGKAGSHRPKSYGVEYRAPGNFWLRNPEMISLVYRLSMFVVDFVAHDGQRQWWADYANLVEGTTYNPDEVRRAIDETNVELAKRLIHELVLPNLPADLKLDMFDEIVEARGITTQHEIAHLTR